MDIHRPKPVHGWREFLKEVGIIVLGVAIALAGEQAVEALHWRHQVTDAREAVDKEVVDNIRGILARQQQIGCADRRLDEVRILLSDQLAGRSLRPHRALVKPTHWSKPTTAWDTAQASQAAAHMPLEVRLAYADAYDMFATYSYLDEKDRAAWWTLTRLNDPALLGPGDWGALREAYGAARTSNQVMRELSAPAHTTAARLGLKGLTPMPDPIPGRSPCTPMFETAAAAPQRAGDAVARPR